MSLPDPTPPPEAATRADLDMLRADLSQEMKRLRADLLREMERLRADMAKMEARLFWRVLGGTGALLALFRLFDLLAR